VLTDAGETASAVDLLTEVRGTMHVKCFPLADAHGETLAANGKRSKSLHAAFDRAAELLPAGPIDPAGLYVALDPIHLARWRGNVLTQFADPDAVAV
jgi:hypothetical protein